MHDLAKRLDDRFGVFTYDGDTPSDARKAIRERGHIVLTNPDMLHTGILPHHTKWMRLFENLRYIVLDELHTYRGVFGSHLANVLRRLRRVAQFYGSESAVHLLFRHDRQSRRTGLATHREGSRSCRGERRAGRGESFSFSTIRRWSIEISAFVAAISMKPRGSPRNCLPASCRRLFSPTAGCIPKFCLPICSRRIRRSRARPEPIRGYRGGYLPGERREIERGLREGRIRGVVTTNALELGIDIGSLDACVMAGYAGSIASTWQRAGRAGRRSGSSCAVFVASSAPLDQFIVQHPDYFFGSSPEHAHIQPDNLEILVNHLKCAAFELPLSPEERFGNVDLPELCERLGEAGFLHQSGGNWHWVQEAYPADTISLRSVTSDNFVIIDTTGEDERRAGGDRRGRFLLRAHHRSSESDLHPPGPAIPRRTAGFRQAQSLREAR